MTEITDGTEQRHQAAMSMRTGCDGPRPALQRGVIGVFVLAMAVGVGLRLWYVFHGPINSDEAIVGLMARGILHGHFVAFYWGQPYGGGEPYVVALLFAIFGQSAYVLQLAPVLLSAVAAVLAWRVARRLVRSPMLALLAGALVWIGPDVLIVNSTREYGFRGVTLVCGLACVLMGLKFLDGSSAWLNLPALGLFAGVGWWSSPEIAYFLVPSGLILLGGLILKRDMVRQWLPPLMAGILATVIGALPWIWANARSHLASLKASSFPGGAVSHLNTGYSGRLSVFFRLAAPTDVSLRHLVSGTGTFSGIGQVVVGAVVVASIATAVVCCLWRRDRATAIGVSLLAFPLLYAAQPGTWYWQDGRYIVFLSPLLALALVAATEPLARALGPPRFGALLRPPTTASLLMTSAVVLVGVLTIVTFTQNNDVSLRSFTSGWGDPNGSVDHAITTLEEHGVRAGFADYWVAYKIDLLARGEMTITPALGDVDRSKSIDAQVNGVPDQAWLFVPPNQIQVGYTQFSGSPVIVGPRAVTEPLFLGALEHLGVAHRTIHAGLLDAVIPARPVTIAEVLAAGG